MKKLLFYLLILIIFFINGCEDNYRYTDEIITDIDGNIYHSVIIGNQIWMVENLKVIRYRNGDSITNIADSAEWFNFCYIDEIGAYCDYDNNEANSDIYGHLYNWSVIIDNRNIAPKGWHIPSELEWTNLVLYLGGNSVAGGKLKESGENHWCNPNNEATNKSGFTALPGGNRSNIFRSIEYLGYWWSKTESTERDDLSWIFCLKNESGESYIMRIGNKVGLSIRCVKD